MWRQQICRLSSLHRKWERLLCLLPQLNKFSWQKPFPSSLASGSRTPTEKVSPSAAWPAPFSVTVKEEGFSAATGQDKQVIVPSMPSGTAALAVPPPATPVRSSQPADGIDHLSIPASPGCAPKLHMNVSGNFFLSQKVARDFFPRTCRSCQPADSTASAASAAAAGLPCVGMTATTTCPRGCGVCFLRSVVFFAAVVA